MRKFADKEQSSNQAIKQTSGSNTEATLILCGYSGERANSCFPNVFDLSGIKNIYLKY